MGFGALYQLSFFIKKIAIIFIYKSYTKSNNFKLLESKRENRL